MSDIPKQRLYKFPVRSLLILSLLALVLGLLYSLSDIPQLISKANADSCDVQYFVCASDMKTYTACLAEKLDVNVVVYGACDAEFQCSLTGPVVCGVDGNEYPNECTAVRLSNVAVERVGPC
ncbi:MAG TPA: Kazal-type serine protease inhibitor domain-containing protein [Acidobacteriota bacterium]|nr:Kazal-type serine protease inhibitor domain-containing protein [Acidobacteriota bacterium]